MTFNVGKEHQKFVLHKNLIEHYSPFFENAFNSGFIEGQTQEMNLRDVDADIFGLVVNWVYTQKIIPPVEEEVRLVELAQLWCLAGKFLIPQLQNQAIKQIDLAESQTSVEDLISEWKEYVSVGLDRNLEGTQLYRKVMDDVLDLFTMIMETSDKLDVFIVGIFGESEGPAARFIKSMIVHCGPFLTKNNTRKPAREYCVNLNTISDEGVLCTVHRMDSSLSRKTTSGRG